MLTAILATTSRGGLGFKGQLPWKAANIASDITKPDMEIFKQVTDGKICLFGANTYRGMRGNRTDDKPLLPNRRAWVLADRALPNLSENDTQFVSQNVLDIALSKLPEEQEVVVCGGLKLYQAFLPRIDKIIWTCFGFEVPHDVTWPYHPNDLEKMGFKLVNRQLVHQLMGVATFYNKNSKAVW